MKMLDRETFKFTWHDESSPAYTVTLAQSQACHQELLNSLISRNTET